ncbi:MAG: acylneuraminate cytidylyltransferase family protein [Longimicrobiales bacterium]
MKEAIALIPARSGSKRIRNKNVRPLGGHPLLAFTISSALESGVFKRVVLSTEDEVTAKIGLHYGAEVPFLRPVEYASDQSPDIDWIRDLLRRLEMAGEGAEYFSILRPTSPFRQASTIRRAWAEFTADDGADSLRAVEKCREHPAKMWRISENRMTSIMPNPDRQSTPWHSMPYQSLPEIYVQNASLEISRCRIPMEMGTIAGEMIMPFFTEGLEGFDINNPEDWALAELYLRHGEAELPPVQREPYGRDD